MSGTKNKDKGVHEEHHEELNKTEHTPENQEGQDDFLNAAEQKTDNGIEEKYAELNDKFIRLYSEFDNYRKRSNKEKVELITTASAGVLKDLLPIVDDFERAIATNATAGDIEVVKEGFHLIYNKLRGILESKGLKAMNTIGEAFDSELHEAIANVPAASDDLKGKIVDDIEKGYFLHDKVVRYAKVIVGQ